MVNDTAADTEAAAAAESAAAEIVCQSCEASSLLRQIALLVLASTSRNKMSEL